jgi:hypothetical protein
MSKRVSDAAVLDALRTALANDDVLYLCGGASPQHIEKHCSLCQTSIRDRLGRLEAEGAVTQVWGYDADLDGYPARQGWLPADHPDASSPHPLRVQND